MFYRLRIVTNEGNNDNFLIEADHGSEHLIEAMITDPGGVGYQLYEVVSLLVPGVKQIQSGQWPEERTTGDIVIPIKYLQWAYLSFLL